MGGLRPRWWWLLWYLWWVTAEFPWIAVGLAFSFGLYGLVKKGLGQMPALTRLTLETLWVTPLAVGLLIWIALTDGLVVTSEGAGLIVLMSLAEW